jgi:hypothetical protein
MPIGIFALAMSGRNACLISLKSNMVLPSLLPTVQLSIPDPAQAVLHMPAVFFLESSVIQHKTMCTPMHVRFSNILQLLFEFDYRRVFKVRPRFSDDRLCTTPRILGSGFVTFSATSAASSAVSDESDAADLLDHARELWNPDEIPIRNHYTSGPK